MSVDIDRIEQMFEYGSMSPALTLHSSQPLRESQLGILREKIRSLEAPRIEQGTYPVLPGLEALFPDSGPRRGVVYSLSGQHTLIWALIAQATQNGHFAATVGLSHLGVRSAEDIGVDLDRLVVVHQPGSHWWHSTSLLSDAVSLVVVAPRGPLPSAHQRDRFEARLRERGSTLLLCGHWPGAEAQISVGRSSWEGLGRGSGLLQRQRLRLILEARRMHQQRAVDLVVSADGVAIEPLQQMVTPLRPAIRETLSPDYQRHAG
jgi:hypothetical protein